MKTINRSIVNATEGIKQRSRKYADERTTINYMNRKGHNANKWSKKILEKNIMYQTKIFRKNQYDNVIKLTSALWFSYSD